MYKNKGIEELCDLMTFCARYRQENKRVANANNQIVNKFITRLRKKFKVGK